MKALLRLFVFREIHPGGSRPGGHREAGIQVKYNSLFETDIVHGITSEFMPGLDVRTRDTR